MRKYLTGQKNGQKDRIDPTYETKKIREGEIVGWIYGGLGVCAERFVVNLDLTDEDEMGGLTTDQLFLHN